MDAQRGYDTKYDTKVFPKHSPDRAELRKLAEVRPALAFRGSVVGTKLGTSSAHQAERRVDAVPITSALPVITAQNR